MDISVEPLFPVMGVNMLRSPISVLPSHLLQQAMLEALLRHLQDCCVWVTRRKWVWCLVLVLPPLSSYLRLSSSRARLLCIVGRAIRGLPRTERVSLYDWVWWISSLLTMFSALTHVSMVPDSISTAISITSAALCPLSTQSAVRICQ